MPPGALGWDIRMKDVAGSGKNARSFDEVPLDEAAPYACEDADITLMAKNVLHGELRKIGLDALMEEVEMPLVPVLMRMERKGRPECAP